MQTSQYHEFLNYPKIVSGKCALENIPSELDGHNAQKPLVITGKSIVRRGLVKKMIKALYDSTIVIGAVYDEVLDYAGISQARDAAQLFSERGCDAVIALGNGPVADLAKAVNVLVSEKTDTLRSYYEGAAISRALKPLLLAPACHFNGWEATNTMTVDNRRITSDHLYPEVIILDPRITQGCCPECLAESGAVTLARAFTALAGETGHPMIDAVAYPAMRILAEHLAEGVRHPRNKVSSQALADAAIMAAAAHSNTEPGMVQLLAEALSSLTGISAGKLTAVLLPPVIAAFQQTNRSVRDELCLAVAGMETYSAIPESERPGKGLEMTLDLAGRLTGVLPGSLKALRVQHYLLDSAASAAAAAGNGRFTVDQCRSVLAQAWEGGRA